MTKFIIDVLAELSLSFRTWIKKKKKKKKKRKKKGNINPIHNLIWL